MSSFIGRCQQRLEDERLVRGEGCFVADEHLPGCVYAAIFRSPVACAKINSIHLSAARQVDGVLAVLTAADVVEDGLGGIPWEVCPPGREKQSRFPGDPEIAEPQPLLAVTSVRYVGEPVALVIAENLSAAVTGADSVSVDFEYGEPVVGIDGIVARKQDGAALFSAEVGSRAGLDDLFSRAFGVAELRTHVPRLAAAPIEPRGYASQYRGDDGGWTLWAAAGKPHPVRDTLARSVFRVDPQKIRLIARDIGGGFGGKNVVHAEAALTLWAAKRLGRPVRWISTRLEAFQSDMQGRDHLIEARLAYDKDGIFKAVSYDAMVDLGAYLSPRGVMPALTSLKTITGPYAIEAAHGRVRGYITNTVPTCTYRGAGAPESAFAIERLVDIVARKLSIDPVEIRRRNLIRPDALPWAAPTGVSFHSVNFPAVLETAAKMAETAGQPGKGDDCRYGTGIAFTIECYAASYGESAEFVVGRDRVIQIRIGTKSAGQSHETTYAQIASAKLGLPIGSFEVVQGDTELVERGNGTGASRSLTVGGSAIICAAEALIEKSRRLASELMQCSLDEVEYAEGRFSKRGELRSSITFFGLSELQPEGLLRASGEFRPERFTIPGGCHVARAKLDPHTGRVSLLSYHLVQDAGVAVNPMIVAGQLHGGIAQGIGAALCEAVRFDPETGQLITASFQDYAMPRADGICSIDVQLLGVPCASNLIGAKPVGEAGAVGPPPAIVNAIINAVGGADIEHLGLPATPERVWRMLHK